MGHTPCAAMLVALALASCAPAPPVPFHPEQRHVDDRASAAQAASAVLVGRGLAVESPAPGVVYTEWMDGGINQYDGLLVRWSVTIGPDGVMTVDLQCRQDERCGNVRPSWLGAQEKARDLADEIWRAASGGAAPATSEGQ